MCVAVDRAHLALTDGCFTPPLPSPERTNPTLEAESTHLQEHHAVGFGRQEEQ